MKFKVGDRVKIVNDNGWSPNVEIGYVGTIMGLDSTEERYAVKFDHYDIASFHSCAGLCPEGYGFWCEETMFEPIPLIPTFDDIRSDSLDCVIHTKTIEEARKLGDYLRSSMFLKPETYWDSYSHNTAFSIRNGVISGYAYVDFYLENKADYGEIYEFKDIEAHSAIQSCIDNTQCSLEEMTEAGKAIKNHLSKNKEDKPMRLTFYTAEDYRIDKSNNTKIPTITTKVTCQSYGSTYHGSATCDKADYSERDGILNAIANAVLGGNFDREYEKFLAGKNHKYDESCKCKICGRNYYEDEKTGKRTPFTPEDARKHEEWHEQNKKNKREKYLIRKEAKRRLAEAEREGKIEQVMKELYKK